MFARLFHTWNDSWGKNVDFFGVVLAGIVVVGVIRVVQMLLKKKHFTIWGPGCGISASDTEVESKVPPTPSPSAIRKPRPQRPAKRSKGKRGR